MNNPSLNQDDFDTYTSDPQRGNDSAVSPFVETSLNEYLESNVFFDDNASSSSSNSFSFLASPLLSDYVSSSRKVWKSTVNVLFSPSSTEQDERDEVSQEEEGGEDYLENSLSSLQITASEDDDEEHGLVLLVTKETEDECLLPSTFSSSTTSCVVKNPTETSQVISAPETMISIDGVNILDYNFHRDTFFSSPKSPSLVKVETTSSNSTIENDRFDSNNSLMNTESSLSINLSSSNKQQPRNSQEPVTYDSNIFSNRRNENQNFSFDERHLFHGDEGGIHTVTFSSPTPTSSNTTSNTQTKQIPTPTTDEETIMTSPHPCLLALENQSIVQFSNGATEKICPKIRNLSIVKPIIHETVTSLVQMTQPVDNYNIQGLHHEQLQDELIVHSPFDQHDTHALLSPYHHSTFNYNLFSIDETITEDQLKMISSPHLSVSSSSSNESLILSSGKINHQPRNSPVLNPTIHEMVTSSVHTEQQVDNYNIQALYHRQKRENLMRYSPFHRHRTHPLSSPCYSTSTTSPFSINESITEDPSEIMASPSLSEYSFSNKPIMMLSLSGKKQSADGESSDEKACNNDNPSKASSNHNFFSPSTSGSDNDDFTNKYTPVDLKRDSYLSLSHDLSSTKKQLNAHSNSFMKQLKGAFQRRTLHLAQSQINSASTTVDNVQSCVEWEENILAARRTTTNMKKVTFSQDCKQGRLQQLDENKDFVEKSLEEVMKPGIHHRRALSSSSANVVLGSRSNDHSDFHHTPFKARPLPASTMDSTGQSGVPKVSKLPVTIPISPQLGVRRKNTKQQEGRKYDSKVLGIPDPRNNRMDHDDGNHFKSPCFSAQAKFSDTVNPLVNDTPCTKGTYLHGLEFLGMTPNSSHRYPHIIDVNIQDFNNIRKNCQTSTECVYPFTLHSSIRAKSREEFEKHRIENELNARRRRIALIESLIKSKQAELQILKPQL